MKRPLRNTSKLAPITPDFAKARKDKIVKLEEIIHAQRRMLRELNIQLKFIQSLAVAKLLPSEQSKSVALKLRPRESR